MTFAQKFVVCLSILFLCGCAAKMKLTQTGFLADYDQLVQSETFKGMRIYKNKAIDINKTYTKIIVAPVEIRLSPAAEKRFTAEEQEKLTTYFHESLQKKLAAGFELTQEPGPGVLLLRAAITDLLPNKVYLNLHWSTTLLGGGIGGASIEAELVDSESKERVLAFIDAKKGKKLKYTKGLTKWGHTKEVLDKWADILVENLNTLQEEPQTKAESQGPHGGRPARWDNKI